MHIIKGLMLKDFLNLKTYVKTLVAISILYIVVSFINNDLTSFIPVIFPLLFGMMGISSFNYDNLSKSDAYISTFPVSKKDMVKARYLYILLITILGAIFGFVLCAILQLIKEGTISNMEEIASTSLGAFCGMIILQVFQIPIMYKFGAEKGRIIQMLAIVLIMVSVSGIISFAIKISPFSLESFLNMLVQYGLFIIAVGVLIVYLISYNVSIRIFNKKEM